MAGGHLMIDGRLEEHNALASLEEARSLARDGAVAAQQQRPRPLDAPALPLGEQTAPGVLLDVLFVLNGWAACRVDPDVEDQVGVRDLLLAQAHVLTTSKR
ncbi:MAG: hypothetical protein U1B78_05330 [Dehalococcoidia bacterium]|nr:hypothetical protein [Dehalococcoidia bacterium]